MGKGLLNKLKISLTTAGIIGTSYFNSTTAQENYIPKYNTLAHKMLMIEDNLDNIPLNTYSNIKTLDKLIDNSKNYIEKKDNYIEKEIAEISQNIYLSIKKELPEILKEEERDKLFPCYKMSLIYLAIGETNKIPFYGVIIRSPLGEFSGHMFLRYDADGKHDPLNPDNPFNKGDINIETTTGEIQENGKYSDEEYLKKYHVLRKNLEKSDYLKNLNENEFLALAYNLRGTKHLKKWKEEKALEDWDKAIELNPNFFEAYYSKAHYHSDGRRYPNDDELKKANNYFSKALEIFPYLEGYYYKRSISFKFENYNKSIENCNKGLNLIKEITKEYLDTLVKDSLYRENLNFYKNLFYFGRYLVYEKLKNFEKAERNLDLSRFYRYKYQNPSYGAVYMMHMINKYKGEKIED